MERGSIKYLIVQIIGIIVAGFIIFPLFDWILCNFITNSKFEYTVNSYIIEPIIFGIILGTVYWVIDKKMLNKK